MEQKLSPAAPQSESSRTKDVPTDPESSWAWVKKYLDRTEPGASEPQIGNVQN